MNTTHETPEAVSNPFRQKASAARAVADRLNGPTAHDTAMANAFPLGAGYGRKGGARRIDATISRATQAVAAHQRAAFLEAQADAFDRGEINAQGRRTNPASRERSDKAYEARMRRAARIAAARAACAGKHRHEVSAETWADAFGYLGGSARQMVIAEHPACANVCTCPQLPTFEVKR